MLSGPEIAIILRTNLAVLLGLTVAWERKATGAPVRGKSVVLATMTCAALTAMSMQIYGNEAARVVAGIVTGIGFLGAGMIIALCYGRSARSNNGSRFVDDEPRRHHRRGWA